MLKVWLGRCLAGFGGKIIALSAIGAALPLGVLMIASGAGRAPTAPLSVAAAAGSLATIIGLAPLLASTAGERLERRFPHAGGGAPIRMSITGQAGVTEDEVRRLL